MGTVDSSTFVRRTRRMLALRLVYLGSPRALCRLLFLGCPHLRSSRPTALFPGNGGLTPDQWAPRSRCTAGCREAGGWRRAWGWRCCRESRVSFPTRSTPTVPSPGTPRMLRHRAIISRWRCGAAGSPSLLQLCFEDGSEGLRPIFFSLMKDLGIKKK